MGHVSDSRSGMMGTSYWTKKVCNIQLSSTVAIHLGVVRVISEKSCGWLFSNRLFMKIFKVVCVLPLSGLRGVNVPVQWPGGSLDGLRRETCSRVSLGSLKKIDSERMSPYHPVDMSRRILEGKRMPRRLSLVPVESEFSYIQPYINKQMRLALRTAWQMIPGTYTAQHCKHADQCMC